MLEIFRNDLSGLNAARFILAQVTQRHTQLDISRCPALGDQGLIALLKGLSAQPGPANGAVRSWMTMVLTQCDLGDAGLQAVLDFAGKAKMQELWMSRNKFEASASSVTTPSRSRRFHPLDQCLTPPEPHSQRQYPPPFRFGHQPVRYPLRPPSRNLSLRGCQFGTEAITAIGDYLCGKRSRPLKSLDLSHNKFKLDDIRRIVERVEQGCFTLLGDGDSNSSAEGDIGLHPTAFHGEDPMEDERIKKEVKRMTALYERNEALADRVKRAASRCLPYARIILNAIPIPTSSTLKTIGSSSVNHHQPFFRILDLPPELVVHVTRHTSGDPTALSDAQFLRLRKEAEDSEGLARAIEAAAKRKKDEQGRFMRESFNDGLDEMRQTRRIQQAKAEWLKSGSWDRWERDV